MVNDAGTWGYGYDPDGRCVSMSSPAGTATFEYYDNGWEKKRTLPNSSYTSYTYNGVGMLTDLVNKKSDGTVRSRFQDFGYNGVFDLMGVKTASHTLGSFNGTASYTYDTKDRLTADANDQGSDGNPNTGPYDYSLSFGYDNAGNPTTFRGASQSFNSDNQRSATGFAYDGNGNPTTYAGQTLAHDVESRLTQATVVDSQSNTNLYNAGFRDEMEVR